MRLNLNLQQGLSGDNKMEYSAFITTFQRPEILGNTIRKLLEQTLAPEKIWIIDNDPNKSAKEVVEKFKNINIAYYSVGENQGPAGGAYHGLKLLFEEGWEWVLWVDDDDPPFFDNVIENLLNSVIHTNDDSVVMIGAVGVRFSHFNSTVQRIPSAELKGLVVVDMVGGGQFPLINRRCYEAGILPNPSLFFGFEDLEFCVQLKKAGFKLVVNGEEMLRHRSLHKRLNFKIPFYSTKHESALWREYYSIRTLSYIQSRLNSNYLYLFILGIKLLLKATLGFSNGWRYGCKNAIYLVEGYWHGIFGKMGNTVQPVKKYPLLNTGNQKEIPKFSYAAFIITYQRPVELKKTIDLLLSQTIPPEKILIVDNDPACCALSVCRLFTKNNLQHFSVGHNSGPSGGAFAGLTELFRENYEWVAWVDDDDPPVFANQLENLGIILNKTNVPPNIGIVGSTGGYFKPIVAKTLRPTNSQLEGVIGVDWVAGNQLPLISRRVFEAMVLPNPDVFFGFEDLEFCLRVKQAGFNILINGQEAFRLRGHFNRLKTNWHKIKQKKSDLLWRDYYSTRTLAYILFHLQPSFVGRNLLFFKCLIKIVSGFLKGATYGKTNMKFLLRGYFDGKKQQLGQTVLPVKK